MNQKRGSFMLQKKKKFKEDLRKDIIEGKISGGMIGGLRRREEASTMSDEHGSGSL